MYYKRYELQRRFNVFFSGSVLAGAFSGLLAYAISKMAGIQGYGGWRWVKISGSSQSPSLLTDSQIFILEGIFTTVAAVCCKWSIVDWPETATFLSDEERTLLVARLALDVGDARMNRLDKVAVKRIFSDWKIYCGILMYIGIVNTGYATSVSLACWQLPSGCKSS